MRQTIYIALLILAACLPAAAEHHRGHVSIHLDEADRMLGAAIMLAESIETLQGLSTTDLNRANKFLLYANKYRDQLTIARTYAATPGADLDTLRAMLDQPGHPNPVTDALNWGVNGLIPMAVTMVHAEFPDVRKPANIVNRLKKSVDSLAMANWHVQDAIREELYNDPDFSQ